MTSQHQRSTAAAVDLMLAIMLLMLLCIGAAYAGFVAWWSSTDVDSLPAGLAHGGLIVIMVAIVIVSVRRVLRAWQQAQFASVWPAAGIALGLAAWFAFAAIVID